MPSIRSIILSALSIAPLVLSQSQPEPSANRPGQATFDFQELLNALPEESIHAALHKHANDKFQDGVYEHDRHAVEQVRNEDPGIATRVLAEAALDLLKRQNSNTTVVTTTTAQDSTTQVQTTTTQGGVGQAPTSTSTSDTAVVVPIQVPTTDSAGSTTVVTTSVVASASVSVVQAVTTTNSKGSTIVTSSTVAAAVVTQANGKVTTSAVPVFVNTPTSAATKPVDVTTTDKAGNTVVLSKVTSGQVITTTDGKGSTFVTTFTPGGGKVSSLVLQTTTLPNGMQSTITSFAVVQAQTSTAGLSSTSGPKLQNGADSFHSRSFGVEAIVLVGGALGVAVLF